MKTHNYLMDVWTLDKVGKKVFPYKGLVGDKRGLFSVNFTSNTSNFEGMTEENLVNAIFAGKFKDRGTIRMLPLDIKPGMERNAFAPKFYKGKSIKDF